MGSGLILNEIQRLASLVNRRSTKIKAGSVHQEATSKKIEITGEAR